MSDFHSVRMLVADDSRTVQRFFNDVVASAPWPLELVTAETGLECMALLDQGDIDLAFIDVHMPEMSGMEAVGRARFKGNKTFVTLMSGKSDERRLKVARQVRAYEYLVKPFTAGDVLDILKTYRSVSKRTRTLIVDDSRTIRQVILRVLKRSVFNLVIDEASSGERALKLFTEGDYDLVFLDYNMPGLDGLDTLKRILSGDPNSKIIMISAERNDVHVREAKAAGAVTFLHKPFFAVDVDRALHDAFGLKLPGLGSFESEPPLAGLLCPPDSEAGDVAGWEQAFRDMVRVD
jgi:CheY-like chemotaxis protein